MKNHKDKREKRFKNIANTLTSQTDDVIIQTNIVMPDASLWLTSKRA